MSSVLTEVAARPDKPAVRLRKSNGWRHLAYRLARRGARLQLVQAWGCDLNSIADPQWDSKYEFRQLDADDLCRLAANPANGLALDTVLRLAAAKHRCFASMNRSNLVCSVWFAQRHVGLEDTMNIPLSLAADTCYLFNAFTAPAFRGQGIYMLTAKRALVEMYQLGKSRAVALIEYGNIASICSHQRVGLKPQGWIVSLGRSGQAYRWYAAAARKHGFGDSTSHKPV
jgi:hypothetical protein